MSVTANTAFAGPLLPSATETPATARLGGGSSSTIVAVPVAAPRSAFTGAASVTVKVSSFSSLVSFTTVTGTVSLTSPGANVTVPVAAVKSVPAVAVPAAVA